MSDPVTLAAGIATVMNTGILTGIFFRLGGVIERVNSIERRVGKLEELST